MYWLQKLNRKIQLACREGLNHHYPFHKPESFFMGLIVFSKRQLVSKLFRNKIRITASFPETKLINYSTSGRL